MNATRARSAAEIAAQAVQAAAKIAQTHNNIDSGVSADPEQKLPLLDRIELSIRYMHDDTRRLQPKIGGKVKLERFGRTFTVWLPADVWQGIASIICQTPDHHRGAVAMVETHLGTDNEALLALIEQIGREVVQDAYVGIPQDDFSEFDLCWA
jgi:hypothetical protein